MELTIKKDNRYTETMIKICLDSGSPPIAVVKRTKEAIKQAAAGIGSPLKKPGSIAFFWTLNRASLNAPHMTNMKQANQPNRPNGSNAH